MAAQASDWLDAPRLARELRVAEGHPAYADMPTLIAGAVQFVSRFTGLPMLDRYPVISRRGPRAPDACLRLGRVVAPIEITAVRWWSTGETDAAEGTLLETGQGAPDVGRLDLDPAHDTAPSLILWPRAAGWPEGMRRVAVTVRAGLIPAEYPALSDACVLHARGQFEGLMLADKRSALERLLEPFIHLDVDAARGV